MDRVIHSPSTWLQYLGARAPDSWSQAHPASDQYSRVVYPLEPMNSANSPLVTVLTSIQKGASSTVCRFRSLSYAVERSSVPMSTRPPGNRTIAPTRDPAVSEGADGAATRTAGTYGLPRLSWSVWRMVSLC